MTANDLSAFVHTPRHGPTAVHSHCEQSEMVTANTSAKGQPCGTHCKENTSVQRDPVTEGYNTNPAKSLPPSPETFGSLRTLVDAPDKKSAMPTRTSRTNRAVLRICNRWRRPSLNT